jgi:hypothetical protein
MSNKVKVEVWSRWVIFKTLFLYFGGMLVVGSLSVMFWRADQKFYGVFLGVVFVLMFLQVFGGSRMKKFSDRLTNWFLRHQR